LTESGNAFSTAFSYELPAHACMCPIVVLLHAEIVIVRIFGV